MTGMAKTGAPAAAIRHHYDEDAAFFRLWLGRSMAYSAALWGPGDTLDEAQNRKLTWIMDQARIGPGSKVLDVGCGWGSYTAVHPEGGICTGLTLSPRQRQYVQAHFPRQRILLQNWQDFYSDEEAFDAMVSIESFEHFAMPGLTRKAKVDGYRRFFRWSAGRLVRGGRLVVQTNVWGAGGPVANDFIGTEIFPESDLPAVDEILEACRGYFTVKLQVEDPENYLKTCDAWRKNLHRHRRAAVEQVGVDQVRRFQRYLHYAKLGFHRGAVGLVRLILEKRDPV